MIDFVVFQPWLSSAGGGKAIVFLPPCRTGSFFIFTVFFVFFSCTSMGIIVVWDGSLSRGCSHQHWAITCPPQGVDKNTRWEWTLQCQVMAGRLQQAHIKQKRPQQCRGEYRSLPDRQRQPTQATASRQFPSSRPGHWVLSVCWPMKGISLHLPRLIIVASQADRIAWLKISIPCGSVCVCMCVEGTPSVCLSHIVHN